jgi:flagellar hook-associated protein 3 FlgL
MTVSGLGDAAGPYRLQQDGLRLRQDLQRLTAEIASGRQSDPGRATGGDFGALAGIARSLQLAETYARSIAEADRAAAARQTALGEVEGALDGLAPRVLAHATGGSLADLDRALADAPGRFAQAVDALNTRLGAASLFAGDAPDRPALRPAAEMLAALRPIAAAAATAADMVAAVEAWFHGGAFDTQAWQGGPGAAAPAVLGDGRQEPVGLTARDPALRGTLAGLALAALAAEGAGPAPEAERRALATAAATRLLSAGDALTGLRADLGAAQARIEGARVGAEATRAGLEMEHTRLTAADPYRSATELQAVQTRLEALYVLTARLSRLSLTEYL